MYLRVVVDCAYGLKQLYNLGFGSVNAEGFDHEPIQRLEVDLGDRCVCSGRNRIDETLKGVLGDDDFINYSLSSSAEGF